MKLPRVYIETTVPSYYYEIREDVESIAKKLITNDWWNNHRYYYELVMGPPVLDELERGDHPSKFETINLIKDLPILKVTEDIIVIVDEYISHYLMPRDPRGDALHLALASYYNCNFLFTWNCQHLANANKFEHIRHINTILGLYVPILTTPYELMHEEVNDESRSNS